MQRIIIKRPGKPDKGKKQKSTSVGRGKLKNTDYREKGRHLGDWRQRPGKERQLETLSEETRNKIINKCASPCCLKKLHNCWHLHEQIIKSDM